MNDELFGSDYKTEDKTSPTTGADENTHSSTGDFSLAASNAIDDEIEKEPRYADGRPRRVVINAIINFE